VRVAALHDVHANVQELVDVNEFLTSRTPKTRMVELLAGITDYDVDRAGAWQWPASAS
jgi:hypothetical protein